jgi:hypothetical protein
VRVQEVSRQQVSPLALVTGGASAAATGPAAMLGLLQVRCHPAAGFHPRTCSRLQARVPSSRCRRLASQLMWSPRMRSQAVPVLAGITHSNAAYSCTAKQCLWAALTMFMTK